MILKPAQKQSVDAGRGIDLIGGSRCFVVVYYSGGFDETHRRYVAPAEIQEPPCLSTCLLLYETFDKCFTCLLLQALFRLICKLLLTLITLVYVCDLIKFELD